MSLDSTAKLRDSSATFRLGSRLKMSCGGCGGRCACGRVGRVRASRPGRLRLHRSHGAAPAATASTPARAPTHLQVAHDVVVDGQAAGHHCLQVLPHLLQPRLEAAQPRHHVAHLAGGVEGAA